MQIFMNDFDPTVCEWLRELQVAGLIPEGTVDERSISEVQPADLVGFRHCHFFCGIFGWGEALRLAGWPADLWTFTGSPPCFPAGTLVLTDSGYCPIETVAVGDLVLTHNGRFMPVTATGSEEADCVTVKGQGHFGLTCTPDHPFYASSGDEEPGWVQAKDLAGKRWATIKEIPTVPFQEPVSAKSGCAFNQDANRWKAKGELNGKVIHLGCFKTKAEASQARRQAITERRVAVRGADAVEVNSLGFARFLGYWIGDGWVSGDSVFLCGSKSDIPLIESIFHAARLPGRGRLEKTSSRIQCGSKHLVAWLKEHFGQMSDGKKIPTWMYGMSDDYREAFLDGYFTADGHTGVQKRGGTPIRVFTTASRALAIGVRVMLNQLGRSASVRCVRNNRETIIEGRHVKEKPSYRVTAYETARSFRFSGSHGWGIVRSVVPAGRHRVYNLAVHEDESYTADGIVVHNCQPFSTAGKRKGKADERHLWPEYFRLIRDVRPLFVFLEQVEGAARLGWLDGVQADLESSDYTFWPVVLGASSGGAPHIRLRFFAVAFRNDTSVVLDERSRTRGVGHAGGLADTGRGRVRPVGRQLGGSAGGVGGEVREQRVRDDAGDGGYARGVANADRRGSDPQLQGQPRQEPDTHGGGEGVDGHSVARGVDDTAGERTGINTTAESRGNGTGDGIPGPASPTCGSGGLADDDGAGRERAGDGGAAGEGGDRAPAVGAVRGGADRADGVAQGDPVGTGLEIPAAQELRGAGRREEGGEPGQSGRNFWSAYDVIHCRDNKWRRIPKGSAEPLLLGLAARLQHGVGGGGVAGGGHGEGSFPLSFEKVEGRAAVLKGVGNSVVPQIAAEFVMAVMEVLGIQPEHVS